MKPAAAESCSLRTDQVNTNLSANAKLTKEQIPIVIRFEVYGLTLNTLTSMNISTRLPINDIAPFVALNRSSAGAARDLARSAQVHLLCQTKLFRTDASTANAVATR